MFKQSAELYDLVYSHKDYAAEAAWVRDAVRARVPHATTLLDVACGTGQHLKHLRGDFSCEGLDLSPELAAIAAERTNVPIHLEDMDSFDLGSRFDAVVCLFSAIGYSGDLDAAIAAMARHCGARGVVIVEPWFTPEQWMPGTLHVLDHEVGGTRVIRMIHSDVDDDIAVMDMHHLVGTDSGVEHFVETHRMTLFTLDQYESAFRRAGLGFELERPGPSGRGALIGQPSE